MAIQQLMTNIIISFVGIYFRLRFPDKQDKNIYEYIKQKGTQDRSFGTTSGESWPWTSDATYCYAQSTKHVEDNRTPPVDP